MIESGPYRRQVALLTRVLPIVAQEKCFALKGGTAINLFIRDMPRFNCEEGPAYGVALLAAVGTGAFLTVDEACQATISVTGETMCDAQAAGYYRRAFPLWKKLYGTLRETFSEIATVEEGASLGV